MDPFCVSAGPGQLPGEAAVLLGRPGAGSVLPCALRPPSGAVREQR